MHAVKDAGIMVQNTYLILNGTKKGGCFAVRLALSLYHDLNVTHRASDQNIKGIRTTIAQFVKVSISVHYLTLYVKTQK